MLKTSSRHVLKTSSRRDEDQQMFAEWMLRRKIGGHFHKIFKELQERDSDGFKGNVRMDVIILKNLLSPFLQKHLSVNFIGKMEKCWLEKFDKYVSENLLKLRGHVGFLTFSHLQHKIFFAETTKISNQFDFFCFSNKNVYEKSCKTKKINMGTRWNIY